MKSLFLKSISVVFTVTMIGCGGGGGGGGEKQPEFLRIVHAAPDGGLITVNLGEAEIIETLPYSEYTEYLDVVEGKLRVRITKKSELIPTVDEEQTIGAGKSYSLFLYEEPDADEVKTQLEADASKAPDPGQFRLRVANFSPTGGAVDVYILPPGERIKDQTPAVTGLAFKAVSDFFDIDAKEFEVKIAPTGEKTLLHTTEALRASAGEVHTLVLIDDEGGGKPIQDIYLLDRTL